jgi:hypothetical protein
MTWLERSLKIRGLFGTGGGRCAKNPGSATHCDGTVKRLLEGQTNTD